MRLGTHSVHRSLRIALLMVGAAVTALLLTQCQMVDDRIAAPRVDILAQPASSASCLSRCSREHAQATRAESELHTQNVMACNDDPACLAVEEARHEAAITALNQERKACMDDCHHQGGGSGGR